MAYTPTEWACGDAITAEKLNKIESELEALSQSGGSQSLIINAASIEGDATTKYVVTDKTWQQVHDAMESGIPCYFGFNADEFSICYAQDVSDLTSDGVVRLPVTRAYIEHGGYGEGDMYGCTYIQPDEESTVGVELAAVDFVEGTCLPDNYLITLPVECNFQ